MNVTKHYSISDRVSSLKSSRYTVNPNFYRIFQRRSAFVLSCKHSYSFTFRCRNVRSLTSFLEDNLVLFFISVPLPVISIARIPFVVSPELTELCYSIL